MIRGLVVEASVGLLIIAALALRYRRHRRPDRLQRVLQVFLNRPSQQLYGLDIAKLAGLPSGSIYPELADLELRHWIRSGWEEHATTPHGPRRLYWLDPDHPSEEL